MVQPDGRAFLSGEVVGVDGQPDGEIELAGEFALLATDFIL